MTAKTRRLRELIASGRFFYMPSAATPLEGRLAEAMGYRGCIDAQILLGAALHAMKRALGEIMATGSYVGLSDAEFMALRKEIEDLIGPDAYYRIEAETVEPAAGTAPA